MDNKKTKILHLTLSMDAGGIENMILNLARHIDKERFRMVVGCLDFGGVLLGEIEKLGVKTFILSRKPGFDLRLIFQLASIMRREKISVIHTHNQAAHFYGALAAFFSPVKNVVTTEHSRHQIDDHWRRRVEKKILSLFTTIIVEVSEELKAASIEKDKISPIKLDVVANGIDIERYKNPSFRLKSIREEFNVEDFIASFGIVGRLHPVKNHHLLLSAFKIFKESYISKVQMLIIGDGELRSELEKRCLELDIIDNVMFCGYRNDIPELMNMLDCLVLCSHTEGFPLTLLEGMAAGVPIVVTRGANGSGLIENERNGIVVESKPSSLAEGMMKALSQTMDLVTSARRTVECYSVATMVKRYESIYSRGMCERKSWRNRKG